MTVLRPKVRRLGGATDLAAVPSATVASLLLPPLHTSLQQTDIMAILAAESCSFFPRPYLELSFFPVARPVVAQQQLSP